MISPQQSDANPFTKIKARSLFFGLLILYLGFSIIYGAIASSFNTIPAPQDPIVTHVIYFFSFSGLCYYLLQKFRQLQINPQYIIGKLYPNYPWFSLVGLAIILLIFSVGAALLSFYFLSLVAPVFFESLMESVSKQNSQSSSIPIIYRCLEIINYTIVAPITEEFIFRGVLLHRLAIKWNLPLAVWGSSIIFGFFHPNPIGISMLGIVWALLYLKTRTLIIPITAHMINNTIVVLGQLLSALIVETNSISESTTNVTDSSWKMGLFLVVLSVPFLIRFIYQKFPYKNQTLPYFANQARESV